MPSYYPEVEPDALRPKGSTADRIMGTDEAERWLKTNFKSPQGAIAFDFVRVHAESLIEMYQLLHERETGIRPDRKDVIRRAPGIQKWLEWHQKGTGHLASVDGFSVKATVRALDLEQDEKAGLGSSTRVKEARKAEAKPERLERREGSL